MGLFIGIACATTVAWAFGDAGRFGSNYYTWKMFRGIAGMLCCLTLWGWFIPVVWWIARMIVFHFKGIYSEWDEIQTYENRRRRHVRS